MYCGWRRVETQLQLQLGSQVPRVHLASVYRMGAVPRVGHPLPWHVLCRILLDGSGFQLSNRLEDLSVVRVGQRYAGIIFADAQ